MDVFSTAGVAPERRADFWNAIYGRFAPVSFTPQGGEAFQAELRLGGAGPVDFAQMRSNSYRAERTKAHAAAVSVRKFGFIIVTDGVGVATHCGRESELGPGDVLLNDNAEPILCRFKGPFSSITVRARDGAVRSRLPFVDDVRGLRLPAGAGFASAVSTMARCLTDQAAQDLAPDHGAAMAGQLLDVLATSYAMAWRRPASEGSAAGRRKAMALQFIESNLSAPDLTPRHVAAALRISPRYLRLLMAEEGESVSALVLRRRLEECARQLASPLCRENTITDVALSWGFNSTAHFARVFKERFGMTPRDYRRSHAPAAAAAAS